MLPTASEGEQDLVGGVGGAGARVVVHRPLGGAQQARRLTRCISRQYSIAPHVGGNPEVGACIVHNSCCSQANVAELAFLVVDWGEQIGEG